MAPTCSVSTKDLRGLVLYIQPFCPFLPPYSGTDPATESSTSCPSVDTSLSPLKTMAPFWLAFGSKSCFTGNQFSGPQSLLCLPRQRPAWGLHLSTGWCRGGPTREDTNSKCCSASKGCGPGRRGLPGETEVSLLCGPSLNQPGF